MNQTRINTVEKKSWKTRLRELKLRHVQATYPAFFKDSGDPDNWLRSWDDSTANGLTKCIVDFIKYSGGDANRINTQGNYRRVNGRMKWTYAGTRKGTADIHAIYQGKHISVEVKIGRDRLSEAQNKERERIEKAGGLYFVASDMESFVEWFDNKFGPTTVQSRLAYES